MIASSRVPTARAQMMTAAAALIAHLAATAEPGAEGEIAEAEIAEGETAGAADAEADMTLEERMIVEVFGVQSVGLKSLKLAAMKEPRTIVSHPRMEAASSTKELKVVLTTEARARVVVATEADIMAEIEVKTKAREIPAPETETPEIETPEIGTPEIEIPAIETHAIVAIAVLEMTVLKETSSALKKNVYISGVGLETGSRRGNSPSL